MKEYKKTLKPGFVKTRSNEPSSLRISPWGEGLKQKRYSKSDFKPFTDLETFSKSTPKPLRYWVKGRYRKNSMRNNWNKDGSNIK